MYLYVNVLGQVTVSAPKMMCESILLCFSYHSPRIRLARNMCVCVFARHWQANHDGMRAEYNKTENYTNGR